MATMSDDIIPLESGWAEILTVGVEPFVSRVEGVDDVDMDKCMIKMNTMMRVYDMVFKMCVQREPYNFSEQLYHCYKKAVEDYLDDVAVTSLVEQSDLHDMAFLREWVKRWARVKRVIKGFETMFQYLNRFFVPSHERYTRLANAGFEIYRLSIFDRFKDRARDCIISSIASERAGDIQDRELLASAVECFVDLGFKLDREIELYHDDLEVPMVVASQTCYSKWSRVWMDEDSTPDYLRRVESCLSKELDRLDRFLHHTSKAPLMSACQSALLMVHQEELLSKNSGIEAMLERNDIDDLSRLFTLYNDIPEGKVPISIAFKDHIRKLGHLLIDRAQGKTAAGKGAYKGAPRDDEHSLIRDIIALHDRYLYVVQECFRKDQLFEKALKESFEDFINKNLYPSNLLARFSNAVLTRGAKVQVDDMERTLNHVVMIYGYIRHKDVFEEHYHSFLAERLLNGRSVSQQAEKTMIAKLKHEAGFQWASKLETMFKDVEKSIDLQSDFNSIHAKTPFSTDLRVIVCTSGCWPSSAPAQVHIPACLQPLTKEFHSYYLSKFSGTKLTWAMHQGEAELEVAFTSEITRLVACPTYMMLILVCFNQKRILSFEEIRNMTQIPKADLETNILSLAHPTKAKILVKKPNVKTILPTDKFMINTKFTSKQFRVQIAQMRVHKADDSSGIGRNLEIQRSHQIDASIVRVMKTRQRLEHNQLIGDVMKQLTRFQPDISQIKKRIEALIEQEYIERDSSDRRVYNYLA